MHSATCVVGLAFGDEGKGAVVDAIVRSLHGSALVVRFNGGPQASHTVVDDSSGVRRVHRFSSFGAGFFAGAETFLSQYVLIDPLLIDAEARALRMVCQGGEPMRLLHVDERCRVITPYDVALNRAREHARGDQRHGSCGLGIGVTVERNLAGITLSGRDLRSRRELFLKLTGVAEWVSATARREGLRLSSHLDRVPSDWAELIGIASADLQIVDAAWWWTNAPSFDQVVFEGAQGFWLDETFGFQPHTTWSDCTPRHARDLFAELSLPDPALRVIGVTRTFMTRHGAGPLPGEDPALVGLIAADANTSNEWQGDFRVGQLDLSLLERACQVVQPDALAVTHMDLAGPDRLIATLQDDLRLPIEIIGRGPSAADYEVRLHLVEAI